MDTNHFFSFSRIAMVMKREIIENWKKNLYAFIGLYAAFALVVVGNMWGMSMNAENAFASPDIFFVRYCTNILGAFIFICLLGSLIYASLSLTKLTISPILQFKYSHKLINTSIETDHYRLLVCT